MQNFRALTATIVAAIVLFGTIATATPVPPVARDDSSQTLATRQVEPQPNIASRDFSSLLPRLEESSVEFEARDIAPSSKIAQPLRRRNPTGVHEPEPTIVRRHDYTLPADPRFSSTQQYQNAINRVDTAFARYDSFRDNKKLLGAPIPVKEQKSVEQELMRARYVVFRQLTPQLYAQRREQFLVETKRLGKMSSYNAILSHEEKQEIADVIEFYEGVDNKYKHLAPIPQPPQPGPQ